MSTSLGLAAGEQVIWQGRPVPGFHMQAMNMRHIAGGVLSGALVVYLIFFNPDAIQVSQRFVWVVLTYAAIGQLLSGLFWAPFLLMRSRYVLTTKRAFITTSPLWFWSRTKRYPIDAGTVLNLEPGPPDTIWFLEETHETDESKIKKSYGFQRIDEGAKVYRLMRKIQTGEA